MKQNGSYNFFHTDHLGTPQKMTDTSGAVVWSAVYDAFGRAHVAAGASVVNNLMYPGQYQDQETGYHYNWHRYYDPEVGRYGSADLVDILLGGINQYIYANDNPQAMIDPLGLFVSHTNKSREAFKTEKCSKLATEATFESGEVDSRPESQDPKNARWHAMANGKIGEGPKTAKRRTEEWITENLGKCTADGLGTAIHAEQDKFAAGHMGYQPWNGERQISHIMRDSLAGDAGDQKAVDASIALIKRFKAMCPAEVCGPCGE